MKKILQILTLLILSASLLPSCSKEKKTGVVPYTTAYNYAYKNRELHSPSENRGKHSNGVNLLSRPSIMSKDEMNHLFEGSPAGQPTPIDFEKNFAIAVVLEKTTMDTELVPGTLYATPDGLVLDYTIRTGGELTEARHPVLMIVVDRGYASDQVTTQQL